MTLEAQLSGVNTLNDPYGNRAAETAVALINTFDILHGEDRAGSADDLVALLRRHGWEVSDELTAGDVQQLKALRPRLRSVFEVEDERRAVEHLNRLLAESQALPQMTDHDGTWHFHYARPEAGVAQRIMTSSAIGLLAVIRDKGSERLGRCSAPDCGNVLVDLSRNRSRRYCDARTCGNRANVAAYRARLRRQEEPI